MGDHFFNPIFAQAEAGEPTLQGFWIYVALVLAIIFGLLSYAKKGFKDRVFKNPITSAFEQLYLFIENMTVGVIGAHGRKYITFVITLWMVIFVGNALSLFMPFSPTADLSFNLGMALISVGYVQYEGIRSNGVVKHFSHFAGPKLGIGYIAITLMIFIIEIISELMKNISLSLRLYGNIHGGHLAVESMNKLGESVYIPVGAFLLPIKLLTVIVQAMIFTILTCVYISLVTHHDEEHHEEATHALEPAHITG
jgi:F-type H+-transporting ATPase subunit a